MRVLLVDANGLALDLAMRWQALGHEVKLFIRNGKTGPSKVGKGLVPRVYDWTDHVRWADLVYVPDNSRYTAPLDDLRRRGVPVFGATQAASEWELDRRKGQEIMQSAGLPIIPTVEFTSLDDAIAYVRKKPDRYVSKPNGDVDKALSYCAKDAKGMVSMLERWKKTSKLKDAFILQEFKKGIEMAVGGWFGGGEFGSHVLENWEFKKLCAGDLGPATGEQGTILHYTADSLLAEKVLYPLTPFLTALGYIGYVDVNCIITPDGTPWPMEFTMRDGWPLRNIAEVLHKDRGPEWMLDLVEGRHTLRVHEKVACGVVLSQPPYPYPRAITDEVEGFPIWCEPSDSIHYCDAMAGTVLNDNLKEEPGIVTAGTYMLVASGTGGTVADAKEAAYDAVEGVEMSNSPMYRPDIGDRLETQLPKLQKMGYAKGIRYE